MSAPPFGRMDVSHVWFAVPYRLVNQKFQKFITGYYQQTEGSSQFLKRPNMMFDFTLYSDTSRQFIKKFFDKNVWQRYSLLDYIGVRCKEAPLNSRVECYRWLSFWMCYYEYFVDQNLGYRPDPIFYNKIDGVSPTYEQITLRTEDGTTIKTSSVLNWEQFTQIVLYSSQKFPSVGGYVTIGDLISNGLDIPVYNLDPRLFCWLFALPSKCWPKDYFTSALPWAQKGNPVTVPVSGNLDSSSVNINTPDSDVVFNAGLATGYGSDGNANVNYFQSADSNGVLRVGSRSLTGVAKGTHSTASFSSNISGLEFTINDLRSSYALQSWLEKNARCGSRYVEQILSHFGVRSSDSRLQRPEYLGGFKMPVQVSSVAQTSEDGNTPQGNLAGNALAAGTGKPITFFAEEHCLIIGFLYVQPQPYYSQGLSRLLTRSEFYDFYFPEFAHLGEQEIKNKEIYNDDSSEVNNDAFGYQSRYSEYKFMNNELHGDFMHDSLRSWIFGVRDFGSRPSLSPEFLQVSESTEPSLLSPWPVVSSDDAFDKLYCQVDFDIRALRPMPKYGTPYL